MASEYALYAKEDRRNIRGETVDIPFLVLILLLLSTACLVGDSYNPFIYFRF